MEEAMVGLVFGEVWVQFSAWPAGGTGAAAHCGVGTALLPSGIPPRATQTHVHGSRPLTLASR